MKLQRPADCVAFAVECYQEIKVVIRRPSRICCIQPRSETLINVVAY